MKVAGLKGGSGTIKTILFDLTYHFLVAIKQYLDLANNSYETAILSLLVLIYYQEY
jgi:hypothetical protein